MDLELSERTVDGNAVVKLRGELDLSAAPDVRDQLLTILNAQPTGNLIVDLSDLEFLDSTGLNVLLSTKRRAGLLGGDLSLVAPQKIVAKVLSVTGLDTHFGIFATVADAAVAHREATSEKLAADREAIPD